MNSRTYPHINNNASSAFPNINTVDVYKYNNTFNYSRWTPNTQIKLCNVAWTSTNEHLPNFETDKKRDDYFTGLEGQKVDLVSATNLKPNDTVKLPVPADVALKYNYMQVKLPVQTSEEEPIKYEIAKRVNVYYFYIQDVESIAPNTTLFTLKLDVWTTYINSVKIEHMTLERGHYPVAMSDVDKYLKSPYHNNKYLLTQDVVFGEAENVKSEQHIGINDDLNSMLACFACTCYPVNGAWGNYYNSTTLDNNQNMSIPTGYSYIVDNVPQYIVFCLPSTELYQFLLDIEETIPQFKQTIKYMFFAQNKLIEKTRQFEMAGHVCHLVDSRPKDFQLLKLEKSKFGFNENEAKFAKLYTFPYSKIVISNENGEVATIKVENVSSSEITANMVLDITANLSVDCFINNINGSPLDFTVAGTDKMSRKLGGSWYKTLTDWKIPSYVIVASPRGTWDTQNYYNRVNQKLAIDTSYSNQTDSADTSYSSAVTSASASLNNANANASTAESNNALQVALNTSIINDSNRASSIDTTYSVELNKATEAYSAGYSRDTIATEAEAETQKTALSNAMNMADSIASGAVAGSGGGGVVGALVGGATGLAMGIVKGSIANEQLAISNNLAATKVELGINNNRTNMQNGNQNAQDKNKLQTETQATQNNLRNTTGTAQTNNNVALTRANASRTYNASVVTAENSRGLTARTRDRNNTLAYQQLENERKQGSYASPNYEFGANNPKATKPMFLQANIITQTPNAITQTANEFAKFGYRLNQYIIPEKWNYMKRFDYWKASDVWVTCPTGINQNIQTELENILKSGVTVWKDYEHIKQGSIYDN